MKIVGYYRVSTKMQGESGLGLAAQREDVKVYAAQMLGKIVGEYTEVESGKRSDRPQLAAALAQAKATGATLVVAKLDRLSRNVAFLSALMESGVPFVACDNPQANKLTLHILAAVAEDEAARTSARTKAALAQAKAKGVKLGAANARCQNLTDEDRAIGQQMGGQATGQRHREFRSVIFPVIKSYETKDLGKIADRLNEDGYVTARGLRWTRDLVRLLVKRGA